MLEMGDRVVKLSQPQFVPQEEEAQEEEALEDSYHKLRNTLSQDIGMWCYITS